MRLSPLLCVLAVFALLVIFTRSAEAAPPDDDVLTPLDAREIQRDVRLSSREEPGEGAPLWLSIAGGVATTDSGYEGLGMLSIGGALDRIASSGGASRAKEPRDPRFAKICARLGLVDYWRTTQHWPDCEAELGRYYDFRAECESAA